MEPEDDFGDMHPGIFRVESQMNLNWRFNTQYSVQLIATHLCFTASFRHSSHSLVYLNESLMDYISFLGKAMVPYLHELCFSGLTKIKAQKRLKAVDHEVCYLILYSGQRLVWRKTLWQKKGCKTVLCGRSERIIWGWVHLFLLCLRLRSGQMTSNLCPVTAGFIKQLYLDSSG